MLLILSFCGFANASRNVAPDADVLLEASWARTRAAAGADAWPTPLPAIFDRHPVPMSDAGEVNDEWRSASHRFSKSFRVAVAFLRAGRTVAAGAELAHLERTLGQLNQLANQTGDDDALARVIQDGVKMALQDFEPLRDEDRERLHAFAVVLGTRLESLDELNSTLNKSIGRERWRLGKEHAKGFAGFTVMGALVLQTFAGHHLDHATVGGIAVVGAAVAMYLTWTPLPKRIRASDPNRVADQWSRCTALLTRANAGPYLP